MATTVPIRILFIGRNTKVADALAALIAENGTLSDEVSSEDPDDHCYLLDFSVVSNQKAALERIRSQPPGIILIEVDAKPKSRSRFLEMVRYRLPTAAILAVGRKKPANAAHFDGYVEAPIDAQATLTLVHDICHASIDHRLQRGSVQLNVATRTVVASNGRFRMTPKQCALLQMLMLRHGQVVSRADIMETIWETSYLEDTRTLYVHIRWLRQCIEPEPSTPKYLVTVRGVGYCLNLEENGG